MNRLLVCITLALALLAAMSGCDYDHQTLDFERMIDQHRYDTYEPAEHFADNSIMRRPPYGTVPRERPLLPPLVERGITLEGAPVETIPIPVTAEVLDWGKNRFEIFCAPCHGILGDSDTQVAENMTLRPPPSLQEPPVLGYPPGRVYRAIASGYGLMRSYAAELPVLDRWAVVAYVEALQLSQHASLEALPEPTRAEARPWLQ